MGEECVATRIAIDADCRSTLLHDGSRNQATDDEVDAFPYFSYARMRSGPRVEDNIDRIDGVDNLRVSPAQALELLANQFSSVHEAILFGAFDMAERWEDLANSLDSLLLSCCYNGAVVADDVRALAMLEDGPISDDACTQQKDATPNRYLEVWADPDEMMGLAFLPDEG